MTYSPPTWVKSLWGQGEALRHPAPPTASPPPSLQSLRGGHHPFSFLLNEVLRSPKLISAPTVSLRSSSTEKETTGS